MGKLGQSLVARGWITVHQLTRALKNQSVVGGRLGTCLLEMDALSEDLLLKALAEQTGVPAATADDLRGIPDEVRALLPAKLARRCRAIAFRAAGGRLDVAVADAHNLACQDEIAFATGKRVKVHVANEIRIFEALEKYYDEECPSRFAHLLDRLNRARYLWEKEAPAPAASGPRPSGLGLTDLEPFARSVHLEPPPLPEPSPLPEARTPPPASPRAAAPSAALPAPPAAPPPSPRRTVALTAEERRALGEAERQRAAAANRTPPASLEAAEAELAATRDREEVGRIVLSWLARGSRRAALFQVGRDRVTGWLAAGAGVDLDAFSRFTASLDQPSLFLNLRGGSGLHVGPMPPMPVHRELARTWGGELPRECLMVPVRLKDRLVVVLYAEPGADGTAGIHLDELKRLADDMARALERCILHRKQVEQAG